MKRAASVLWLVLAACGRAPAPSTEAAADSAVVAAAPAPPPVTFDPGRIQPGDTVGGLTVVSKDVERAVDSVWVGTVVFEGDLVVQGVYQPHPDWPSVQAPCFHVNDPASAARVPRFAPDSWTQPDAPVWFCFSNPDVALDVLGNAEQPHEMVIALSRYQIWRELGDVTDTAELSELLQVGAATTRTLLESSPGSSARP